MEMLAVNETRGFHRADLSPALQRRLCFLHPRDRKIVEFTLLGRLSRREIALLVGLSPGHVSRRVGRLLNLLHDPLVVSLIDDGHLLPELHRDIGLAYFLRGQPLREIARDLRISRYQVQRALARIRGWHDANRRRTAADRRVGLESES